MMSWAGVKPRAAFIDLEQALPVGAPLPPAAEMVLTPTCAAPEYIRHWRGVVDATAATTATPAADTFCFGVMFARLYGVTAFDDNASAIATLLPLGGTVPPSRLEELSKPKQDIVRALCYPDPVARPSMSSVHANLVRSRGMTIQAEILTGVREARTLAVEAKAQSMEALAQSVDANAQSVEAMRTALTALRCVSCLPIARALVHLLAWLRAGALRRFRMASAQRWSGCCCCCVRLMWMCDVVVGN